MKRSILKRFSLKNGSRTKSTQPGYEDILQIRKEKLSPALLTYYQTPLYMQKGSMQYLWDHNGRKYLDLFGGIVTVSVGHCHPRINEALKHQLDRLWHTTSIYMTSPIHEYAEKLTATLPDPLKVCFIVNSGSEANDMALLMARLHTGRFDLVSLRNGYHGLTQTVMGVTNLSTWKQPAPIGFGMHRTVNPDPYKGPWGGDKCRDSPSQTDRKCDCLAGQCNAADKYVDQLLDLLDFGIPKQGLAGFLLESIQGVGGVVQYPKGFMRRAFEIVRERGGICIADEVQTGFGRLGSHFWGFETQDAVPDIVTMAKGMGNGFPIGAVVTTPEIAKSLTNALFFNTFGGNPLACTVGSAVIDVIHDEKLQLNSQVVGTYFLEELAKLKSRFNVIGDIRGKGLMIGMELVEDQKTRKPLPAKSVSDVFESLKDCGILIGKGGLHGNVLRIAPPMCITKEDVDFAVKAFTKSFESV